MISQILFILAMICISDALHQSFGFDEIRIGFSKCTNLTGEERKLCRSEFVQEAQLKLLNLQLAHFQLQMEILDNNLRTGPTGSAAEIRANTAEIHANMTFEQNLRKDEAVDRSLVFPGLTVDPDNSKSGLVALVTLCSCIAFGILNCSRHNSNYRCFGRIGEVDRIFAEHRDH